MDLHRRQFTTGLIAIAAATPLGSVKAALPILPNSEVLESARQVGTAYLNQRPHEADREWLLSALRESLSGTQKPDGALKGQLRSLIQRDFSMGRTVTLDGWMLSETECRICALSTKL